MHRKKVEIGVHKKSGSIIKISEKNIKSKSIDLWLMKCFKNQPYTFIIPPIT